MINKLKKTMVFVLVFALVLSTGLLTAFAAEGYVQEADPETGLVPEPLVEVKQGTLRGFMEEGMYKFYGVRYAQAERFMMPEEAPSWEGVKDAQGYGPISPIPEHTTVSTDEFNVPHRYWIQDENCQYLNIWTQDMNTAAKKPVMVWLHGGGFNNGSSIEGIAYDGANLSKYGDVVVVSLNHRLNVLGFLDLSAYGEEYKYSGNVGMADIVMALEWINENIEQFGGDPGNVTVFGQSGGGSKTSTLMHMPSAEGLMHKAAVLSGGDGTIGGMMSSNKESKMQASALMLEKLNLTEDEVDQLKDMEYETLLNAANEAIAEVRESGGNANWGPGADEDLITTEYCDWATDIPTLFGSVFGEFNYSFTEENAGKNEWSDEEVMSRLNEKYGENADAVLAEFNALFPDKKDADAYFYDTMFTPMSARGAQIKSEMGGAPTYRYLFTYELPVNGGTILMHCGDLPFIFHNVSKMTGATGGTQNSYDFQDVVSTAWINFAYTGDPSQDGLPWEPYTVENKNTMIFDIESGQRSYDDSTLISLMTGN